MWCCLITLGPWQRTPGGALIIVQEEEQWEATTSLWGHQCLRCCNWTLIQPEAGDPLMDKISIDCLPKAGDPLMDKTKNRELI